MPAQEPEPELARLARVMRRSLLGRWLVIAIVLVLTAAACEGETPPSGSAGSAASLAGTSWTVVAVDARQAVRGAEPTLVLTATGATGTGGCNSFGGSYRYDPATGSIAFQDMAMTLMLCLDHPRNEFEAAFFQALVAANRAAIDAAGRLHLAGPAGEILLVRSGTS